MTVADSASSAVVSTAVFQIELGRKSCPDSFPQSLAALVLVLPPLGLAPPEAVVMVVVLPPEAAVPLPAPPLQAMGNRQTASNRRAVRESFIMDLGSDQCNRETWRISSLAHAIMRRPPKPEWVEVSVVKGKDT